MNTKFLTGDMLLEMVRSGAECLQSHCDEVNDLNVFPIPDGDTGSNMFLTIQGGANTECSLERISDTAESIAHNMLLSARGNSGVILSQLFAGIADGLKGLESASMSDIENACKLGVDLEKYDNLSRYAYDIEDCPSGYLASVLSDMDKCFHSWIDSFFALGWSWRWQEL